MLALFPQRCLFHNHEGLIKREATELATSYVRNFLEGCLDDGFATLDLPDVFYTYERVHRWQSNFFWERAPTEDVFPLFCTRPFVEAAYSISALHRYSEPIHYRLIHDLEPKLLNFPISTPWRSQIHPIFRFGWYAAGAAMRRVPFFTKVHGVAMEAGTWMPMYDRPAWLEAKRHQIRDICLSQPHSAAWHFVNRRVFEHLTSTKTDANERRRSGEFLFAVAAIFYYEMFSSDRTKP
jgi:asparagine synthase (glutamine-hydrolysing)